MLQLSDWGEIADVRVDRRDMEALRVAQDYQQTGVVQSKDLSFEGDATPAANKVDAQQIREGKLDQRHQASVGKTTRNQGGWQID
jgi:ubiquinone biosynthesis protein UbiJ